MALESTETNLQPPPSEPGQLLLPDTLSATNTNGTTIDPNPPGALFPKDSTPYQSGRKDHIRDYISKPSVQVFIALVLITAFSFLPAALSNLGGSNGTSEPSLGDYVLFSGEIFKFDWQKTDTVSIQWTLSGVGQYQLEGLPNRALDIYVDNTSQPFFSYVLPPHNPSRITPVSAYSFKTDRDTLYCKPLYYAPEDCYSISASVFAIDKETNDSVPLQFIISDAGAGDFAGQFDPFDNVVDFTRDVGGQPVTTEVNSYLLFADITRSKRSRALTYFIFAVNWLLTLCSIITTAFIFRRRGKLGDSIAIIPITLVLTIPTIRGFYPGNPPFGVRIDLVGFFPQMLSVVFCIVVMLVGFAMQYNKKKEKTAFELEGLQTGAPFEGTAGHIDEE